MRLPASLRWARKFLPDYFCDKPAPFHAELMGDLENAERRLIARVAPRGHAKSTCAALAYPLWCICEQRRRNIVIITHESALATQFVRDIRNELEVNDRIIDKYGDLCKEPATKRRSDGATKGKARRHGGTKARSVGRKTAKRRARPKWSEAIFTTATGITVQAKSAGGSLRGARVGPSRPD